MHNKVFKDLHVDALYTRIHLKDGAALRKNFFDMKLSGANVTVPHKEAAFNACDEVRGFATKVGVVNTLVNENGKLIGYNTDADGFLYSIEAFEDIKTILVIGAGGTAKALVQRFLEESLHVEVLNRSEGSLEYFKALNINTYTHQNMPTKKYDLIVNTTSAGLKDENYPAPLELLTSLIQECSYVADAIYGKKTPFLQLAEQLNKPYKDGSDMLLAQGVLANEYFTANSYKKDKIFSAMKKSFEL